MLKEMLRNLSAEFGYLAEDEAKEVEQSVLNRLDRSVKLDEVDTVTFGLETDDGKIVKVYVKADQAEDFEKALADKLGEIDDIEEVLNELSKEYEIVDVEWPDEEKDEEDDEEDDGSDVLDKKVYDNAKEQASIEKTLKPKVESLSVGESVTLALNESANPNSIESRFNTATQLMVYHAILELGIPEIALTRSPYRTQIIKAIKAKATELSSNGSMKNALKTFINKSIDYDRKAHENSVKDDKSVHDKSQMHETTGTLSNAELACNFKYGSEKFDTGHKVQVIGEEGDYYIVKPFPVMATSHLKMKKASIKLLDKIQTPIGGLSGPAPGLNEAKPPEWSFDMEDEDVIIQTDSLKVKLGPEEIEKLIKAITNKDTVIVRDQEDPTHKVAFSPRGTSLMVKKVGTPTYIMMKYKQVSEFLEYVSQGKDEDEEDTETDDKATVDAEVDTTSAKPEKKEKPE